MSRFSDLWSGLSPQGKRGTVAGGVVAVALLLAGAVALGTGGGDDADSAATTTSVGATTTTIAEVTTTTEPDTGPVAPLTGLRIADAALVARPPVAVKIDNLDAPSETALPQRGLPKADIVFEEIVEGNITRLVAVFHSQDPGIVGPIRSARTTDLAILPQFGRPILAWSGGNDGVVAAVRSNPSIIDAGADAASGAYQRIGGNGRKREHTLYANIDELFSRAAEGSPGPVPIFGYRAPDQPAPPTAQASAGADISWGGGGASAPVSWRWDPELRLYLREQRGHIHADESGERIAATNVVVLATEYGISPADARSPEALTVGSGELFAYTDGTVVHGRWDRPDVNRPATLVDDTGAPVLLTPGNTWIELPRPGGTTNVS